jgi:hypothetical protein
VGYLVFIDTADLSILADVEHFVLSEVQWDPTGRYLTVITMGNNKVGLCLYRILLFCLGILLACEESSFCMRSAVIEAQFLHGEGMIWQISLLNQLYNLSVIQL